MRAKAVHRQVAKPAHDVLDCIAQSVEEPRALLGGIGVFNGRVSGNRFWFRTNIGPKADWAMTLRGHVASSGAGSVVEATVSTPPFGRVALALVAMLFLAAVLRAPQGIIGPLGLLAFLGVFGAALDFIFHWHHPCDDLLKHLASCTGDGNPELPE